MLDTNLILYRENLYTVVHTIRTLITPKRHYFHKPLILIHQRADRMKTTKTSQTDHMDHSLVELNETMSHAM